MTDAVMTSPDKSGIKGEHPKLHHVLGHDLWRRRIPSKIVFPQPPSKVTLGILLCHL
jgi:hypothetical protein